MQGTTVETEPEARRPSAQAQREARFSALLDAFLPFHSTGLNVSLHLATTPLGLYGALALPSAIFWPATVAVGGAYALALRRTLPPRTGRRSFYLVALLTAIAASWPISPWLAAALVVVAYLAQDAAHALSGESTFERSYRHEPGWVARYALHTFYLLPLVLAAAGRTRGSLLGWLAPKRQSIQTRFVEVDDTARIARVAAWSTERAGDGRSTQHWWCDDLPDEIREACDALARSSRLEAMFTEHHGPGTAVEPLPDMNEVYVSAPPGELSSDQVFYMPHVDGPWSVFPGASVYRCLVGLTPNRNVRTRFPLDESGEESETRDAGITLTQGEALAFDFNRAPHYIERIVDDPDRGSDTGGPRITLKLHYLVYRRPLNAWARLLGNWTTRYDRRARQLFVETLAPTRLVERWTARMILIQTWLWERLTRHIGLGNLTWLALSAAASMLMGSVALFVAAVSFIHYALYIATWSAIGEAPERVSVGAFKRNAIFWKCVSMATLACLYLQTAPIGLVSVVGVTFGFGLAALAALRLGSERTYFGAELGRVTPKRIDRFPYGSIPHPMIVGSIIGLLGLEAHAPFREAWPWVVPAHIALYLTHLGQELRGPRPSETNASRPIPHGG